MLAASSPTPTAIILDQHVDNWSAWHQALKLLCFTKFGVAGQQILSNKLIPLQPFQNEPTKNDLDTTEAGVPIIGQFTYARRFIAGDETPLVPVPDPANLPLSTQGNTNFRDDKKIYSAAKLLFSNHDTECLDHLYRHLSLASHTAIKTHADYPAYQLLPIGSRSYAFYVMIRSIHSIGNAATKLHRTRLYVNISQADLPHEAYMDLVTTMTETFKLDFESVEHPGYVSIPELTSFLYLAGLNRGEFRRALDELLQNHPTGRFPNPTALMSQLQSWKIANSLSFTRDEVSAQGSALIASTPSNPPPRTKKDTPTAKKDAPTRSHLHPTPCTWCLNTDKIQRFGHLSSHCSKNPNRLTGPSPTTTPSNTANPSTTSQRLRALLGQLDLAATPDASNTAMLLIAEAAIEAADYPDTA